MIADTNMRSVTLREPQSLIGLLNFWSSVATPGRAFLRRLIDLTAGVTLPHHYIRLNTELIKCSVGASSWMNWISVEKPFHFEIQVF